MQVKMNLSFAKMTEIVIFKKIDFKWGSSICQMLLHRIFENTGAVIYVRKTQDP
jgi:hypothetical protein